MSGVHRALIAWPCCTDIFLRHRALAPPEQQAVLDLLHCERFMDKAPPQVWAELLDEGLYFCSLSTMYRILKAHEEVRERRNQLRHPNHPAPRLVATAPNQVWSWDITKLLGPVKWTFYYLYVLLDIYSRYVVGWMVARLESEALARCLIEESCKKQDVVPGQLTLHADRSASMTSKPVALLVGYGVYRRGGKRWSGLPDGVLSSSPFGQAFTCPRPCRRVASRRPWHRENAAFVACMENLLDL